MLINLRNALMAGKRLPYDAEVEFLESTGTQYIDTGVKPSSDLRTKFRAAYTHTPIENNSTIFGSRSTASSNDRYWLNYDSKFEVGYGSYYNTGVTVSPGEMFDVDFNYIENGDHKFKINDSVFTYSGTPNTTIGIILFGRIVGAQVTRCSSRFYSAQFFRNGVLIRDYIPVRKGTVGYLYDRVTGKLFGNAGTGDFVVGPDVVPVEYLEGTGTQYIDTGIDAQSCEIRCDFDLGDVNIYETVFGVQSPANNFLEARRNGSASSLQVLARNQNTTVALQTGRNSFVGTWDSSGCSGALNGTAFSISSGAVVGSAGYHIFLFAANQDKAPAYYLSGKIYSFEMSNNGTPFYKPVPIRVGSGSTWEGAMMDVLTRRVYRNAGTGAFTYGNDLRYPIPAE